jgi:flagellar motor switch protein FliN/FliY
MAEEDKVPVDESSERAEAAGDNQAVPAQRDPGVASAIAPESAITENLDLLSGVELPVTLCFGRRRLRLREVLELNAGSVVELDREVEDPVELLLEGRVIARGEVVVVDGSYGLRVLEVVHGTTA